jgi:hypothetical protein
VFVLDRRVTHAEPKATWSNMSGGGRVEATIGRVDLAASAYRGFDGLGPTTLELEPFDPARPGLAGRLVQHHPRFTMLGGDFETVVGEWSLRGEVAAFVEKTLLQAVQPGLVAGRSFDAGLGVDRRAGEYRLFASAIVHTECRQRPVRRAHGREPRGIDRAALGRSLSCADVRRRTQRRIGVQRGPFAWSVRRNLRSTRQPASFRHRRRHDQPVQRSRLRVRSIDGISSVAVS